MSSGSNQLWYLMRNLWPACGLATWTHLVSWPTETIRYHFDFATELPDSLFAVEDARAAK